jgi:hypothetical protein
MIEPTLAVEALLAHKNFWRTTVCFSLWRATLLACFDVDSTNF